jgi:hypothetical protein
MAIHREKVEMLPMNTGALATVANGGMKNGE